MSVTSDGKLRIEPVYDGQGTVVTQYKVVDEKGTLQFQGSYTECYYYIYSDEPIEPIDFAGNVNWNY